MTFQDRPLPMAIAPPRVTVLMASPVTLMDTAIGVSVRVQHIGAPSVWFEALVDRYCPQWSIGVGVVAFLRQLDEAISIPNKRDRNAFFQALLDEHTEPF